MTTDLMLESRVTKLEQAAHAQAATSKTQQKALDAMSEQHTATVGTASNLLQAVNKLADLVQHQNVVIQGMQLEINRLKQDGSND